MSAAAQGNDGDEMPAEPVLSIAERTSAEGAAVLALGGELARKPDSRSVGPPAPARRWSSTIYAFSARSGRESLSR